MTKKTPLYNTLRDGIIIHKELTFAQVTEAMGVMLGCPDRIALVSDMVKAGYTLQALPPR